MEDIGVLQQTVFLQVDHCSEGSKVNSSHSFLCVLVSGFASKSLEVESQCSNPLCYRGPQKCSPQPFSWIAFYIILILAMLGSSLRPFLVCWFLCI